MSSGDIKYGFRFGMLLQFAVRPVALFIFQTALAGGFITAATGVIGAAPVNAVFIVTAIIGTFIAICYIIILGRLLTANNPERK